MVATTHRRRKLEQFKHGTTASEPLLKIILERREALAWEEWTFIIEDFFCGSESTSIVSFVIG